MDTDTYPEYIAVNGNGVHIGPDDILRDEYTDERWKFVEVTAPATRRRGARIRVRRPINDEVVEFPAADFGLRVCIIRDIREFNRTHR
jgi:hypothetical protein